MEKFSQRENVLLGYLPHQSFSNVNANTNSNASSPQDVNFSDVFGGPPRRSSMYEIRQRYSFTGSADSESSRGGSGVEQNGDDEDEDDTHPYMREKPVFGGEDTGNRRRRKGNDFFDDIFKGDESSCSTPRKQQDRSDPFSSAPGSRVLSPARPPKSDPLGISVPSPLSLTPKLTKGVDLPTFGSPTRSALRSKDQAYDGISYSQSPSHSLSRFSSQSIQVQEEPQNDIRSFYRQSSLSREVSHGSEELSNAIQSESTDKGGNLKNGANGSEVVSDSLQFHFSIYRWGSKGVPLVMHHRRGRNSSRQKEMGIAEMPFSSKGSLLNVADKLTNVDKPSFSGSMEASATSFGMNNKKGNDSHLRTPSIAESSQMVEEEVTFFPDSVAVISRVEKTVKIVSSDTIMDNTREKMKPNSQSEVGLGGKSEKESQAVEQEVLKSDGVKLLRSLFNDDSTEQDNHDKSVKAGGKLLKKSNKKASVEKIQVGKKAKKQDEKPNALTSTEADKSSAEGSPKKSGNNLGRSKVKGKMKELVKIFNHEVSPKTKTVVDPQSQSQSCRWDGTFRPEKEASHRTARMDQKVQPHLNKETASQDASILELKKVTTAEVYEYLKQSEKRYSATKTDNYTSSNTAKLKSTSVSSTASDPDVSKTVVGDPDESFQQDFVMQELPLEKNEEPQPSKDQEDMQVHDSKIRKWSSGKEGNIRSLLSTLQYVLWPESGWKPVPLVNIIEGNAVKRAYQRALLCLHPDKLQQKGAASHQKYIAEKVFDILLEAWTQFNSLGSL